MNDRKSAMCSRESICDENGFYTDESREVMCYQHRHESCPKMAKVFSALLEKKSPV